MQLQVQVIRSLVGVLQAARAPELQIAQHQMEQMKLSLQHLLQLLQVLTH